MGAEVAILLSAIVVMFLAPSFSLPGPGWLSLSLSAPQPSWLSSRMRRSCYLLISSFTLLLLLRAALAGNERRS